MIGIALAGGGARGAAHLGVLQAFEEQGIQADCYAGTSAGSIVAAAKALGKSNTDIKKFLLEVDMSIMDYDYWGILKALPRGLSTAEAITKGKKLRAFLHENFNTNLWKVQYPLAMASTDINTGTQVIYSSHDLNFPEPIDDLIQIYDKYTYLNVSQMVYSSCALPGIFPPLLFDKRKLVDGGLVNNLPADLAKGMGATKVIAIDLHGDKQETHGIPSLVAATITTLVEQNSELSLQNSGNHLYLNVPLGNITVLQFNRSEEAYDLGYYYGHQIIDKVKAYLGT